MLRNYSKTLLNFQPVLEIWPFFLRPPALGCWLRLPVKRSSFRLLEAIFINDFYRLPLKSLVSGSWEPFLKFIFPAPASAPSKKSGYGFWELFSVVLPDPFPVSESRFDKSGSGSLYKGPDLDSRLRLSNTALN